MRKLRPIIAFLFVLFIVTGCRKKEEKAYSFPLANENNINEQTLSEAYVRAGEIRNLRSLLVARNNVLISEVYFATNAQDDLHDVMSVTKSFTSTLIGIAIDKGYITGLDQTLGEFIDSSVYNLPEDKAAISLYNMLRMSAGIPWKELGGESEFVDWYYHSADHINYILDKEMTYTPGTQFNYSDGTAHLVSVVLTEATGMTALEFAVENLFEPLGIEAYSWTADNRGYNFGGVRLKITPLTMLKFGQMILDNGFHESHQIVSASWIEEATRSHIETGDIVPFQNGYGLFWWTGRTNGVDYFFANGYGGQFIVILPALEMVVVASNTISGVPDATCGEQWYQTMDVIVNYIIPAAV